MTGETGFIGSNLVRKLQSENIDFVIVDNLSTCTIENLPSNLQ